nr:hypothetical protein [Streptomyces phaeofaciens]
MVPPVHSRIFFALDFFFAGRRPRRFGGSSGAPRRRRGPGTRPGAPSGESDSGSGSR